FTEPAEVLAEDTMFLFWVPQADASVNTLEKTNLGTLLHGQALAPFWNAILNKHDDGKLTYEQDARRRLLKRWRTEFTGCWAWGMLAPLPDENERTVALFSTRHPEPAKSLRLLRDAGDLGEETKEDEWVRGIHVRGYGHGKAGAAIKNLTVVAHSKALVKQVIDQAAQAEVRPALSGTPWFQAAERALPEKPLVAFAVHPPSLLNAFDEKDRTLLCKMGLGEWRWSSATLHARDGLLHERLAVRIEGERLGWSKALNFRRHEPKLAALCPPEAFAFVSIPLEGARSLEDGLALYEVFRDDEQLLALIRKAITQSRFAEALAPLKGEAAVWVLPPRDAKESAVPVLQAVVETPGAADAQAASDALASLIRLASDMKELVVEKQIGEHAAYVFDLKHLDEEATFQPAWTCIGSRIVFGADERALADLLKRLDPKAPAAGLDAKGDFKRALAAIPADERGMLGYVSAAGAARAYWATMRAQFQENDEALAEKLPEDAEFLKDFPATIVSIYGTEDGLRYHAAGGIPPISSCTAYMTAVILAFFPR
ncbi:MAG: hypothetical protein KIS92_11710, partial [Planctomycetota bacterium]|nr:hypothetical protein [Planctomycetota bacterium]